MSMIRATIRHTRAAAAWGFVAGSVGVVAVGMTHLYANPETLRIGAFSDLYLRLGLSDSLMISVLLVLPFGVAVVAAGVILWRRSDDRSSVFLAVGLVALYLFASGATIGINTVWMRNLIGSISIVLVTWFLVGFPTASIIPRWGRIAPAATVAIAAVDPGFAARLREMLTDGAVSGSGEAAVLLAVLGVAVVAQVTRYRRHSTQTQRYQTRWVLLGLVLMMIPPAILIGLGASGVASRLAGWLVLASALGSLVLPVAVAVAVFRHHLYDLDRIISRTVTYGLMAFVIAAVYSVPVVVLPDMLGLSSDLTVALATLAAAAMFAPVRRRVQSMVARRYDRERYDAQRLVETFSGNLQSAVDLGVVTEELRGAVGVALRPSVVSIWITEGAAR